MHSSSPFILSASPGELADALGEADAALQQAGERLDALERELRRRGIDRAAGVRYAVLLSAGGTFIIDRDRLGEALGAAE